MPSPCAPLPVSRSGWRDSPARLGLCLTRLAPPPDIERMLRDRPPEDAPWLCVNPEVVRSEGMERRYEGCLSIPGELGPVFRPRVIHATYFMPCGATEHATLSEVAARVFSHELDHLDGVLFTDRVGNPEVGIRAPLPPLAVLRGADPSPCPPSARLASSSRTWCPPSAFAGPRCSCRTASRRCCPAPLRDDSGGPLDRLRRGSQPHLRGAGWATLPTTPSARRRR